MSTPARLKRLGLSHLASDPKALGDELMRRVGLDQLRERALLAQQQQNPQTPNAPQAATTPQHPSLSVLTTTR